MLPDVPARADVRGPVSECSESQRVPGADAAIKDWLEWGIAALAALDPDEAKASAERLLEKAAGFRRSDLYLNFSSRLSPEKAKQYLGWIRERCRRVPTAYLIGEAGFWRETLEVGPGCLVPRPETETLVERLAADSGFRNTDSFHLLDLACGSGAAGIALMRMYPAAQATFADISTEALEYTQRNLARYGLMDRARIVCSDLFQQLTGAGKFWDVIVCNPPYLSAEDLAGLQPELMHEPRLALDGGPDGLDFYRHIVRQAADYLKPGGWLGFETGRGQARAVAALLKQEKHFHSINIYQDTGAIERVVTAKTGF